MESSPALSQAYTSVDPGFVGGLVGWPGHERLIIPSAWLAQLTPQVIAVQITRRTGVLATGGRLRGVALALLWNLSGFPLSTWLSGWNLGDIAGLLTSALWFTIWSFGGLLLLPSLSRPAVFESDQFALDRGVSPALIAETIQVLDQLQDNEPARALFGLNVSFTQSHPFPAGCGIFNLKARHTVPGKEPGRRYTFPGPALDSFPEQSTATPAVLSFGCSFLGIEFLTLEIA